MTGMTNVVNDKAKQLLYRQVTRYINQNNVGLQIITFPLHLLTLRRPCLKKKIWFTLHI